MFGGSELIVILAVAFVLFGPQKMPEIGRSLGKALRELHKVRNEFMNGLDSGLDGLGGLDDETPPRRKS